MSLSESEYKHERLVRGVEVLVRAFHTQMPRLHPFDIDAMVWLAFWSSLPMERRHRHEYAHLVSTLDPYLRTLYGLFHNVIVRIRQGVRLQEHELLADDSDWEAWMRRL